MNRKKDFDERSDSIGRRSTWCRSRSALWTRHHVTEIWTPSHSRPRTHIESLYPVLRIQTLRENGRYTRSTKGPPSKCLSRRCGRRGGGSAQDVRQRNTPRPLPTSESTKVCDVVPCGSGMSLFSLPSFNSCRY